MHKTNPDGTRSKVPVQGKEAVARYTALGFSFVEETGKKEKPFEQRLSEDLKLEEEKEKIKAKYKTEGEKIGTTQKDFEFTFYGKEVPEMRGTEQYKKDRLDWIRKTKEASPYIDALNRQLDVTAKKEASNLRKEFNQLPEVKQFSEIRFRKDVMNEAIKESETTNNFVAVDQAIITTFNKMTDPDSVVRESEYLRTAADLALWNRLKGKIQKMKAGGAGLTQDDRLAIQKISTRFFDVAERKYKDRLHEYKGYMSNYVPDVDKYMNPKESSTSMTKDYSSMSNEELLNRLGK